MKKPEAVGLATRPVDWHPHPNSDYLGEATVAPITRKLHGIPSEVVLGPDDGLPEPCAVNLDHVQTVARRRLGTLVTTLTGRRMAQIREVLLFALGFQ